MITQSRSANARRRISILLASALGLGILLAGFVAPGQPETATAADLSQFDPGNIASDQVFYNANAMGGGDIQAFLNSKGSSCKGQGGAPCIKDFTQSTYTRASDDRCPGTYVGANDQSAATIINGVAKACGINPQVLIVTLQKEQGLITATNPTAAKYNIAMGYACPDTAPCDAKYYGFFNQVYMAAWQFKSYAVNPTKFSYRAGLVNQVRYHPNAACGSSAVYIQNKATAGLYNYTPYQPNAASLASGYGTGDACSSYGNRNFFNYFSDWFGSPTGGNQGPVGWLDAAVGKVESFDVRGWALDPDTTDPITIHVYVDGLAVKAITANGSRPDVGAVYGLGNNHGFSATIAVSPGTHQVCIYGINIPQGPNPQIACSQISVQTSSNRTPIGSIDLAVGSIEAISVGGWALDPDTSASINVHAYIDGNFAGIVTANSSRTDVGAVYGLGNNHGFNAVFPAAAGQRNLCLYGINVPAGTNSLLGCRQVKVAPNQTPVGRFDAAKGNAGSVWVGGWALDPDTTNPIAVHVYIDGVGTAITASNSRADVGAVYKLGNNHGFDATISAPAGTHSVCVYGINQPAGINTLIGCKTVTSTENRNPFGSLDSITGGSGSARVVGWALDPDTTGPVMVHAYVDGVATQAFSAALSRPDVATVYGLGDKHGFDQNIAMAPGQHQVCLYMINQPAGPNPQLGCRTVTVTASAAKTSAAVGSLDSAQASGANLSVRGWAADPSTSDPISVKVIVDNAPFDALANEPRPDVAAATGLGLDRGFSATVPVAPGNHTVCVAAVSPTGSADEVLECQDVVVD